MNRRLTAVIATAGIGLAAVTLSACSNSSDDSNTLPVVSSSAPADSGTASADTSMSGAATDSSSSDGTASGGATSDGTAGTASAMSSPAAS